MGGGIATIAKKKRRRKKRGEEVSRGYFYKKGGVWPIIGLIKSPIWKPKTPKIDIFPLSLLNKK